MEPEEGDLDQYGNQRRNPYPLGTLVFEQFSGGKGRIVDTVAPGEMQAIVTDTGTAAGIGVIGYDPEALQSAVKKAAVLCTGKKSENQHPDIQARRQVSGHSLQAQR